MREHYEQTERDFVNMIIDEFNNRTEYIEYIGIPLLHILKKTLNADSIKVDFIDDKLIYTKCNPVISEPHPDIFMGKPVLSYNLYSFSSEDNSKIYRDYSKWILWYFDLIRELVKDNCIILVSMDKEAKKIAINKLDIGSFTEFKENGELKTVTGTSFSQNIDFYKEAFGIDVFSTIVITQKLTDLVKNDFKSSEQCRFEHEIVIIQTQHKEALSAEEAHHTITIKKASRQIKIAWGAFGFSVITLFVTIGFNYYGTVNTKSPTVEERLIQINQSIEKLSSPKVNKIEISDDTTKVKVIDGQKRLKD